MTLKYILRSFRRRKVRTLLILLSLVFAVGMVVTLSAVVDTQRQFSVELIAQRSGGYDLALSKTETASDQFIRVEQTTAVVRQAVPSVEAVVPRFKGMADIEHGSRQGTATFLALDPKNDKLGVMKAISGTLDIGPGRVVILQGTAGSFDLHVGDSFDLYYTLPTPRREGYAGSTGASSARAHTIATVAGIVMQQGLLSSDTQSAVIADLSFTQEWLGLKGRSQQLLIRWNPAIYATTNPQMAVFQARQLAEKVQAALGDDYNYDLGKVKALDSSQQMFAMQQALINVYGLMALGIVGLLVRTLIQNNVIENRRDMAVLRILGASRRRLFGMVIIEVGLLGVVGAGIGVIVGILLNGYVVAPWIFKSLYELGGVATAPIVSAGTIIPPVVMAIVVLGISALAPARQASATKVMHAINPGAADNIGLDDIAKFRERQPSGRVFVIGLSLAIACVILFYGSHYAFTFGDITLISVLIFGSLLTMVIGVAMMFSVLSVPFERLLLALLRWIAPRREFFVSRYVKRGKERNTWISLMIVLSATLPVFLATEMAVSGANIANQIEMMNGAPINARVTSGTMIGGFVFDIGTNTRVSQELLRRKPSIISEFRAVPGIERVVGLTYAYRAKTADMVDVRSANVSFYGLTGSLNGIVYPKWVEFVGSGPEVLDRLVTEKNSVIISEGLAQHLNIPLGGPIRVTGRGLDHIIELRVIGIARRLPGFFYDIGRNQQTARSGNSSALVSLETFHEIAHDPVQGKPDPDQPVLMRFMATAKPEAKLEDVSKSLRAAFTLKHKMVISVTEEDIRLFQQQFQQSRVIMAVLTVISFITAVFGVFAVIYVAVNSRRMEIGMMKAVGSSNSHLLLTFILEAAVMSVSAVLAGITAGATLGYFDQYSSSLTTELPVAFAVDTLVAPLTVALVVVASIISAALASRTVLGRKAIQILREAQ